MSDKIKLEIKQFLEQANLSTYEREVYLELLLSNNLNARELSEKSGVPTGRIYEVLEELKKKEMIEVQESRPKIYRALTFNLAFNNLISYINNKSKSKIAYLIDQAKKLENKIYKSDFLVKKETSRVFWSTSYGWLSIFELYIKRFKMLKENLLMTGFLNENTLKILPQAKRFYREILNALNRGVRVKYLWSFEFDERPLPSHQKLRNLELFEALSKKMSDLFSLSLNINGFEMRFIQKKVPTYFDIFDNNRILMKLQNPIKPWQIFACMNVLDPKLAIELRDKFYQLWEIEANYL